MSSALNLSVNECFSLPLQTPMTQHFDSEGSFFLNKKIIIGLKFKRKKYKGHVEFPKKATNYKRW